MTELSRLGESLADRYRIDRELGSGGMATVYLAHDLRHDRDVAMKVLRPELAAVIGADRFLAEIKTTANLQHPHILSLFDSGSVDGTVFYVMPFIDGETLRDRLTREKQLPVADALRITREVADALEYAHSHGVIHRDIKPENILLQGGHALVADFGIALAASRIGSERMTQTGMSLGTPHYMSPEQAMGERELDARTDIYALGCVLYEMLAGEPPFTGPTAQSIVAKLITEGATPIRAKRATVPDNVEDALGIALQKLPADRFGTAAAFVAALDSQGTDARRERPAAQSRAEARAPGLARLAAVGIIALVVPLVAFMFGRTTSGKPTPAAITFGRNIHVTWDPALEVTPAISPDGKSVAYAFGSLTKMRVMVRPVGEGRALPLTGDTTAAEANPQWSPDGSRVLFLSRYGLFSAPAAGGQPRPEVPGDSASPVTSGTWSPDGKRIAFARGDSLFIRNDDASVRIIARMPEPSLCTWSPDGAFIACSTGNSLYSTAGIAFGNLAPSRVVLCRVSDGALTTVSDTISLNTSPAWSGDGRDVYFVSNRDGPNDIYVLRIRADGSAIGAPTRLSTGLGAHTISMAPNGNRVAYARYNVRTTVWSMPLPTSLPGTTAAARRITNANENIETFTVSRDARWIVYDSDLTGNSDIFRVPVTGGEPERLTADPADDFAPDMSPDGKEVVFHSWRGGSRDLYVMRLDGGGVERITNTAAQEANAAWSPDGKAIVFNNLTTGGGIWIVRRDAAGKWGTPVLRHAGGLAPTWSPDGKLLMFATEAVGGKSAIMPVESGPERLVIDRTDRAGRIVMNARWASPTSIYYETADARGITTLWLLASFGATPTEVVRFDPLAFPVSRGQFEVRNGTFYLPGEARESDVWVMEVRKQ